MEEKSKRKFVFDTSALITVGMIKIIDKILEFCEIMITPSVLKELEDFAKYEDKYGLASKEVLKYKDYFKIMIPNLKEKIEFVQDTDNELYNLAKEKSLILITDDIKLSRHIANKITTYFSTRLIITLVISNNMKKKEALNLIEKLKGDRNWEKNIIYLSTKKALEEILK